MSTVIDDDWIKAYSRHVPFSNTPTPAVLSKEKASTLKYSFHRTTKNKALVLVLVDVETGEEVCAFFNVNVAVQRGKNKGSYHRTGVNGQFYPELRGKFRMFWMKAIGKEPSRWAKAYKELRPRLKGLLLTADVTTAIRANGESYQKANNLRRVNPFLEQRQHNGETFCDQGGTKVGTTLEHLGNNKKEQNIAANPMPARVPSFSNRTRVKPHKNTITREHVGTITQSPSTIVDRCFPEEIPDDAEEF